MTNLIFSANLYLCSWWYVFNS